MFGFHKNNPHPHKQNQFTSNVNPHVLLGIGIMEKAKFTTKTPTGNTVSSSCPLCKKNCPLSAPDCRKGTAYLNKLFTQEELQMKNYNNTIMTHSDTEPEDIAASGTGRERSSCERLALLFHRAVKFMMRAHHQQGHVEHAQMRVLEILKHNGSINQRDLLEMVHVRSASLSELLGKLENRNLLSRSRDERDKRNFIITITEQGQLVAETVESTRQQSFDAIFAKLSEDERKQLAELLQKVIATMEQQITDHHSHHGHDAGHMLKHEHEHRNHFREHDRCNLHERAGEVSRGRSKDVHDRRRGGHDTE